MLRAFLRLPYAERRIALAAAVLLPMAAITLRFSSAHRAHAIAPARGKLRSVTPVDAQRIAELVGMVAARLPGRPQCLTRAMVVCRMLRARGVDARLRIGARHEGERLEAHAWGEVDGLPLGHDGETAHRHAELRPARMG